MSRLAPIVLFTYRRPEHTERMLASLLDNPEAHESRLFVYSDGPRSERDVALVRATREVVKSCPLRNVSLIERERNWGLANNVIDGVTRACADFGRAIVLEDDLVVSHTFLEYMNRALDRYADDKRVYHVSGYMFPLDLRADADVVFLPFISSYGWATWARAWRAFDPSASAYNRLVNNPSLKRRFDLDGNYRFFAMLEAFSQGKVDSWAIRWYLSVFTADGLAVFPARSLVENRGFGEGATHHAGERSRQFAAVATPFRPRKYDDPAIDRAVYARVSHFLGWELTLRAKLQRRALRLMRRLHLR